MANVGELTILRQRQAGGGIAAQNSATLHLAIGAAERFDRLVVERPSGGLPSGELQQTRDVKAGALVSFYEDPDTTRDESGFVSKSTIRRHDT